MVQVSSAIDLVIGLGEIGRPLKEILEKSYNVIGKDIDPIEDPGKIRVLHICYPFQTNDFIETTISYVAEYEPELTIVHSTVIPGTICRIFKHTGGMLAYSPVRGKHQRMRQELMAYTKFIAGTTPEAAVSAREHLKDAGFKVKEVATCESLELAKLIETTYFGLLIAWAQEVERYCITLGVRYDDAMLLTEEVKYLPPVTFQPGFIGGHCIIPNINLLKMVCQSEFLDLILASNDKKEKEWLQQGKDLTERIAPLPKQLQEHQ